MEANGKMRVPAPISVVPATATWLRSSTRSPRLTSGPTTQNGPIFTPAASRAPSSTIAVGWTWTSAIFTRKGACVGGIGKHRADFGFGHDLTVHLRFAFEAPDAAAVADLLDVIVKLIAGQHGLAKLGVVDAHEVDELGVIIFSDVRNAKRTGRLRQPLDDQHTGHHRKLREMALKEWLVDRDVLDADAAFVSIHVVHAIDEQERIAVRQQLHHCHYIRRAKLFAGLCLVVHNRQTPKSRSPKRNRQPRSISSRPALVLRHSCPCRAPRAA